MSISYYNDLTLMHAATGLHPSAPITLVDRNYYCLQYNHGGTITVRVDDEPPRRIHGPSLLITSPGHRFVFGNNEGWHHNYIAFCGKRVERYIRSGLLPVDKPLLRIRNSGEFLKQFGQCVNALRARDFLNAIHHLEGLLIKLHTPANLLTPPPHHDEIRELAAAMREAPAETHALGREAARMHISEAHLRRLFRKLVGCAPGRFLLQCRLTAAADRLATSRDPIKRLTADYRFESVHHFSRVFSKQYGLPPGRFRRETLGE